MTTWQDIGTEGLAPLRYRHIKRGTTYRILYEATMQCNGPLDMHRVVVYLGEQDGRVWVRPVEEFADRFERVFDLPSPPSKEGE